jgi:FkbM family methyltransferase
MKGTTRREIRFSRAKAVMSSLAGLSLVKFLLAVAANSRPRTRFLAHNLLKLIAHGPSVIYTYKIGGRTLTGFLRWKHINSDVEVALELAVGDNYRLQQLPQPDFVIDGGANIGLFTLAAAARWPKAPIIAFEPVLENVEAIRAHLRANHFENQIKVEEVALAGSDGSKRFFIRRSGQAGFVASDLPTLETVDVACCALAQFLPEDPDLLKLIKLDIEGGEVEVLDALFANGGLKKTMIVMELHDTPVTKPWIEELARRIGYDIEFYEFGRGTAHCQLTSPDLA